MKVPFYLGSQPSAVSRQLKLAVSSSLLVNKIVNCHSDRVASATSGGICGSSRRLIPPLWWSWVSGQGPPDGFALSRLAGIRQCRDPVKAKCLADVVECVNAEVPQGLRLTEQRFDVP